MKIASNSAPKERKRDFTDAERLAPRLIAGELILSFIAGGEQALWRMLTRRRKQLVRDRANLQNQSEAYLEQVQMWIRKDGRDRKIISYATANSPATGSGWILRELAGKMDRCNLDRLRVLLTRRGDHVRG